MGYSIFEETMVDTTWSEIDKIQKDDTIVLFPMGVIEEHGPHLCLGTDIYISYASCKEIKKSLEKLGQKVLIAPPYYWGINKVTGAFTGSFTVRKETMKNMLYDILTCINKWGFKNVFCFYGHGDGDHIQTIIDAVVEIRKDTSLNAKIVVEEYLLQRLGLRGDENHLLVIKPPIDTPSSNGVNSLFDIHAGACETADMQFYYPQLVKIDIAKSLKSTSLTMEQLTQWSSGGEATKELVPLGYAGAPSDYEKEQLTQDFIDYLSDFAAQNIVASLKSKT